VLRGALLSAAIQKVGGSNFPQPGRLAAGARTLSFALRQASHACVVLPRLTPSTGPAVVVELGGSLRLLGLRGRGGERCGTTGGEREPSVDPDAPAVSGGDGGGGPDTGKGAAAALGSDGRRVADGRLCLTTTGGGAGVWGSGESDELAVDEQRLL
jgi:hypothetical protein